MEMTGATVGDVRPVIKTFLDGITAEQFRLLTLGTPDDTTKVLLVELLQELITCISNAIVTRLQAKIQLTEDDVTTIVGRTLRQSFAEELDVEEAHVLCDELATHISKEVSASVNSSDSDDGKPFLNRRPTPHSKLNVMIRHVGKMFKNISLKVKNVCAPRPRTPRSSPRASSPLTQSETLSDFVIRAFDGDDRKSRCSSKLPEDAEKDEIPERTPSRGSAEFKAVEDIFLNAVHEISEPYLDQVDEAGYEQQQSETLEDIQSLIEESMLISEEPSTTKTSVKQKGVKVSTQIKAFIAKCFAKTWGYRIVNQLRTKYHRLSKVESTSTLKSLMSTIDDLIVTEDDDKVVCVPVSDGSTLEFTELVNAFYDEIIPPQLRQKKTVPRKNNMYADVGNRVSMFLTLMNWWLTEQLGSHSNKVALAILDTELFTQRKLPWSAADDQRVAADAARKEEEIRQKEKNRKLVEHLVAKLMSRVFQKYVQCKAYRSKRDNFMKRVIELIWLDIEDVNHNLTPKTFDTLEKAIFKDLCKYFASTDRVALAIVSGEDEFEDYTVGFIVAHLTSPPKRRSGFRRFFSAVGKALCRPFRC